MPNVIYMPHNPNNMGQMISQLALMKVAQNMRLEEAEIEAKHREAREAEQARREEEIGAAKISMTPGVSELPGDSYSPPPGGNVFSYAGKQYAYSSPKSQLPKGYIEVGGKLYKDVGGGNLQLVENAKPEKPVNMPPWYDSLAVEKLGSKYGTPEGQKEFADWVASDEGKKVSAEYRSRYARESATPYYNFMPTAEGFVPGNARTGQAGEPTGYGKPLPSEQIVAEQQIGTLKETLSRVEKTYNDDYVGPVGGRYGQLKGSWVGLPQEQAEFYADNAQINNTLIYLMSGKQINESEYVRLKKQLPSPELPPSTYKARMVAFRKTIQSIEDERAKNKGGYGPRKKVQQPSGPKQGTVEDGYVFQGGDPANPKNWLKVK